MTFLNPFDNPDLDNPIDRQARINPFLKKAKKLLHSSRHRDLVSLCSQILEKDSTASEKYGFRAGDHMAEVFSAKGFALQELGDLEGAFENFSQAIARDCSYFSCYRERGLILARLLAAGKHPSCCPPDLQQQADKDFSTYLQYFPERSDELAMLILKTREEKSSRLRESAGESELRKATMNAPSSCLAAVVMVGTAAGGLWVWHHLLFARDSSWELLLFFVVTFAYILWYRRYTLIFAGDNTFLLGRQLAFLVFPFFANLVLIALWYSYGSWRIAVLIAIPAAWIIAKGLQLTIFAHEYTYRDRT